jgi:hypothetical protein
VWVRAGGSLAFDSCLLITGLVSSMVAITLCSVVMGAAQFEGVGKLDGHIGVQG